MTDKQTTLARARNNESAILRGLADTGQVRVAEALGLSESVVSRIKSERVAELAAVMAVCGLRVVPADEFSYPTEYINSLRYMAQHGLTLPAEHFATTGAATHAE